jgi:hypothetical protein
MLSGHETLLHHDIRLDCLRYDGTREKAMLRLRTVTEAHELAESILHKGRGLFTQVEIYTLDGLVETVQSRERPAA